MSDDNERSVASAGSVVGDRDIIARLRDWRSVHLARLHEVMEQAADEIELLRGYRDEAEAEASIASLAVERLRLTDAEREALSWFTGGRGPVCPQHLATIRNLMARFS